MSEDDFTLQEKGKLTLVTTTPPSIYGRRQEGPTKGELIRRLEVGMKADEGEFAGLDMASRQSIEALIKRMEEAKKDG